MNKKWKDFPMKKKTLKAFLSEEDGKIAKKNIAKFGIMIISGAMVLVSGMKPHDVSATCAHSNHGSHASHGSHSSHGSHASHCNEPIQCIGWGWCFDPCHSSHGSHCSGTWCD